MEKPLVSIITPIYNAESFLAETIASALGQAWKNIELILVDDGSTDRSSALARSHASDQVKVFCQPNKGASAARNRGLLEARGKYVQFLDADDLLSVDKISLQVTALEGNPGRVAACSTIHFKNGSPYQNGIKTRDEDLFLADDEDPVHFLVNLLGGYEKKGSMIGVHAWLTPRSVIDRSGPWNENISTDDDGEFFSRVILNSNGVLKTGGYSYYRKHPWSDRSLSYQLDEKSITSKLDATLLKKGHLKRHTDAAAADMAIYKQLLYLAINAYITYPHLYRRIARELKKYPDLQADPLMGGSRINTVAKILGWKTARMAQYILAKLGLR